MYHMHSRPGSRAGFLLDFSFKNKESFVLLFVFTVNRQFKALGLHVRRWKWKPPFFFLQNASGTAETARVPAGICKCILLPRHKSPQ